MPQRMRAVIKAKVRRSISVSFFGRALFEYNVYKYNVQATY